jgi:hypothetical protein
MRRDMASKRREVLLFMPAARAHGLQRRMATSPRFRSLSVSPLYRVGNGWAVMLETAAQSAPRPAVRRKHSA